MEMPSSKKLQIFDQLRGIYVDLVFSSTNFNIARTFYVYCLMTLGAFNQ